MQHHTLQSPQFVKPSAPVLVRRLSIFAPVLLTACAALGIDPAMFDEVAPPPPIAADTQLRLASGTWISPEGTRVRFSILVPPMTPGDRLPLVLALHGRVPGDTVPAWHGQQLVEELIGPALRPLGALIVAPDAPGNNWTDPVTERAMLSLMDEMHRRYPIDSKRTLVTGFSMGGMGAWFLAQQHPNLFRAAVSVAGQPVTRMPFVDPAQVRAAFRQLSTSGDGWTSAFRTVPVYAIHSRQDQTVPFASESTLVAQIRTNGGMVSLAVIDSLPHLPAMIYQGALRAAVPWIRRQWSRP